MSNNSIFAAGVDTGSSFTRCIIGVLEGERLRIIGYGSVPSEGWSKSRIADQNAVSACVLAAVEAAEAMAGVQVGNVVAGFGGFTSRGANNRGRHDLGRPREIEQRDINRAMERALRIQLQEDRMVLQMLPQDFVVDEQPGFHDPRGMIGSFIEANAHLITVSAQEHNNLVGAINRAHLAVDETVYEAFAASYAAVLNSDRREGVAVLDIGLHSTELICYYGESAQMVATLPLCGDHFSRDLAHALVIPADAAAVVKREFGSAVAEGTPETSFVEIPRGDAASAELRDAPRAFINHVLESRAEVLFEMVKAELARVGMANAITSGIVLCGAAAQLPGLCDVAERVLQCPARLGLAQGFIDWPEELNDPSWTTVAGLAMYSARLRSRVDLERQSVGALGRILR